MSTPVKITDHVGQALARVLSVDQGDSVYTGLIELFAGRTQGTEDGIASMIGMLADRSAVAWETTSDVLDKIGSIVGVERQGLDDSEYLPLLLAQRVLLKSSGTSSQMLEAMNLLVSTWTPTTIYSEPNCVIWFDVVNLGAAAPMERLIDLLAKSKPAGVPMVVQWGDSDALVWGTGLWGTGEWAYSRRE